MTSAAENGALFGQRVTVEQVEEGRELAPKFDAQGFIPCVTTDFHSGEVLMVAVMNREALAKTIETGLLVATVRPVGESLPVAASIAKTTIECEFWLAA